MKMPRRDLLLVPLAAGDVAFALESERKTTYDVSPGMVAPGEIRPTPGTWIGREGSADEMARAIVFLAADESGFITGVDIPVEGGRILGPHNCDM